MKKNINILISNNIKVFKKGIFILSTLFISALNYGQNLVGQVDDRCRTKNFRKIDGWGEFPVQAGQSIDVHDPRIEMQGLIKLSRGDRGTFEATYKIVNADNTTIAQVLNHDPRSSDKHKPVVFIIADPSGNNWRIRDKGEHLATISKNQEFHLKVETYYNSSATKAYSDIYIDGIKKSTRTHARIGSRNQMRYGNYHHGSGTSIIRVKNATWNTTAGNGAYEEIDPEDEIIDEEQEALEIYNEALKTPPPTQEEIDTNSEAYDKAPNMTLVENIDLNSIEKAAIGPVNLHSRSIARSQGLEAQKVTIDEGIWKYENSTQTINDIQVTEKIPSDYITKIDASIKRGENVTKSADKMDTGIPYFDYIGTGIRESEKEFIENYTKANRKTTALLGAVAVTTETQLDARQKLNLQAVKDPSFINYRKRCDAYLHESKKKKCQIKVDYLEESMKTVNTVISSYGASDMDMDNSIAEQIREKYITIHNSVVNELERIRHHAENNAATNKVLEAYNIARRIPQP